jgi:hypothetical protein
MNSRKLRYIVVERAWVILDDLSFLWGLCFTFADGYFLVFIKVYKTLNVVKSCIWTSAFLGRNSFIIDFCELAMGLIEIIPFAIVCESLAVLVGVKLRGNRVMSRTWAMLSLFGNVISVIPGSDAKTRRLLEIILGHVTCRVKIIVIVIY